MNVALKCASVLCCTHTPQQLWKSEQAVVVLCHAVCSYFFYVNADMYSVKGEVLKTHVLTLISKSHH